MHYPNHFFFLSDGKVLVDGAKNSIVLDLADSKIYRLNASAKRIIQLGEKGLKVGETTEKLSADIEASEVYSFLDELSGKGLIQISPSSKKQCIEEKPCFGLDFLWIEVTSRCNLHCVHCYAEASEKMQLDGLSSNEIKKVISQAAELGCRRLQFTGGEATLRKDLKNLIEHAKTEGFEFIEIFTNGTLLEEDMIKFLAEKGIHVALSIYSYRPETHDAITKVKGSYERTIGSLKLLLAYGVSTRCAIVAMKQNEEELDGTTHYLAKLGVLDRSPDPIRPSGRGKTMDNVPEKYMRRFMRTKPVFLVSQKTYYRNRQMNSCWFGKLAITNSGDVLPCVFSRDQIAGNVKEQDLANIVKSERMMNFWTLTKDKIEKCKDCEYRYVCEDCRPLAYGFENNLFGKSPRCTYDPYSGEWMETDEANGLANGCIDKP